jgi:hypothetical protein
MNRDTPVSNDDIDLRHLSCIITNKTRHFVTSRRLDAEELSVKVRLIRIDRTNYVGKWVFPGCTHVAAATNVAVQQLMTPRMQSRQYIYDLVEGISRSFWNNQPMYQREEH